MKLRYTDSRNLSGLGAMCHQMSDRGWMPLPAQRRFRPLKFNRVLGIGISSALLLGGTDFSEGVISRAIASPHLVAQVDAAARPILQMGSEGAQVSELQAILQLLGYYNGAIDGLYQTGTADAVAAFQQSVGLPADGIVGPVTWSRLLPAAAAETTTPERVTQPTATPRSTPPTGSPTPISNPPRPSPTLPATPAPNPQPARPQPTRPTPAPTTDVDLPVLRIGMSGPAIARLQDRLRHLGFYEGEIDGVFGSQTQAAVRAAQANFDLEVDGVVGSATWRALLR